MNDEEIRYAIIIGINDYETSPLKFCVNDAIDLKKNLIDNCMFYDENIFMITSENGNTIKDITGRYMESIRKIKENFRAEKDSILFYFAGHGGSKDGKSLICFQESNYPIEDIFNNISLLRPRIQTYIIDSCESGNKVLTRNKDSELKNYIKNSNGAMFLYACQNTETAQELSDLEHGLLTYKILEAIDKQSLYDEDGYLTFSRIVEYVQKEISSFSDFKQIPVMENNITGFYPFAMKKNKIDMKNVED
ncbi:caspase family protein, partial [Clostridium sp.]|uniref:caspase family protein n=1 Tax=Clostridium sp. TaxID=1506 RepID=UPI00260A0185